MAKPKLALIPSAQGSKFYSVLPSSGVGDFDFTRSGSATRINSQGLIETVGSGVSRLNYPMIDGVVKGCPHHILEPQRSNLLVQSNKFNTNWLDSNTNVTSGYLGLDGTNSAWLLTKTASSFSNIRQNITFSGIHTFSVYLKKGTNTSAVIRSTGGNDARVEIDLINGTTSGELNTTSVKTESMGNDWWRCSMTLNASSNTAVRIYPESPLGGTTAGNIYMQYAQLEQGSYATSYIPTTTSAVTRSAETATGSGDASTFNSEQGVLMFEGSALANDGTFRILSLSNGGTSNEIKIQLSSVDNTIGYGVVVGGFPQIDRFYTTNSTLLNNKIAAKIQRK